MSLTNNVVSFKQPGPDPEVIERFSCTTQPSVKFKKNAHKQKNVKKFSFSQAQIGEECYFSYQLISVTFFSNKNCWHFNIYEQEKFYAQLSLA